MNGTNAAADTGQSAAIRHRDGPALIIAGPGSGKTFTLTRRLEHLINTYHKDPSEILIITFTNAAAEEMKKRARIHIGMDAGAVTIGTFHSVFFRILKNTFSINVSNILKKQDKFIILGGIARKLGIDEADMGGVTDELSGYISRRKNGVISCSGFGKETDEQVFSLYSERLRELRLLDFDDMILKCRSLFEKDRALLEKWQERYRYIMIDEFQDTNPVQYETIRCLAGERANLCVVGDDDQSVYGFRGAGPEILRRFLADYPQTRVYELTINYRCRAPIADAADKVISENPDRIEKHHSSFDRTGDEVDIRCFRDRAEEITAIKEAVEISHPEDCCLLVRTNEMASYFADELERRGIPTDLRGKKKSLYDTDTGKDVVSYLRLASGRYDRGDLIRVMNKPMRYIEREAYGNEHALVEDAASFYKGAGYVYDNALRFADDIRLMQKLSPRAAVRYIMKVVGYEKYLKKEGRDTKELYLLYERSAGYASVRQWLDSISEQNDCRDSRRDASGPGRPSVSVMTLHACKGLEFAEVFIADVNDGIIPYHRAELKKEKEEERRLLYVGMTRAARKLHLFYTEEKQMPPSSFLKPILGTDH